MSYCLNLDCSKPHNPDDGNFCLNCGAKLLLKDRYRATQPLGLGGCSKTFAAVDQDRLNHPCVIKLFLLQPQQDQKATELFYQEAVRLYELGKHEQITDLYAHFELDNRLYLVQEYIDGETLLDELEPKEETTERIYQESQICEILTDLLPVLQFIHEQGVIHRDIKPANIMRRRSDGKLVLIDFGVAKQATGTILGEPGTMIGTLGYAPAEQLQSGIAYPASDIYALGTTCIHLLTGTHPFNLYNPLEGCLHWRDSLPQGHEINPQLGTILERMVKNLPKERYQSAAEVLQDLASLEGSRARIEPEALVESASELGKVVTLASEKGVDYSRLKELLTAQKWLEADQETRQKMLQVMGKQEQGYLENEDIKQFPCHDLSTIDQLWMHYSNAHFGFSQQKHIWLEVGGKPGVYNLETYEKFGTCVGWRINDSWKLYSQLNFSLDAPPGHLPLAMAIGWGIGAMELVGVEGAVEADCFFSRLEICKL
ncbi:MAG: serine/threonine-protein kinase [Coleofasciculaceae cyanobacterium]